MACYFLAVNNSVSKKALTDPLPSCFATKIEVPLRKMKKRRELSFIKKLENSKAFVFSEPALSHLIPQKEADEEIFFSSIISEALALKIKKTNMAPKRIVLYDPKEDLTLSALKFFDYPVLFGKNALSVANALYPLTGVSFPIVSGTDENDFVLTSSTIPDTPYKFIAGFNISSGENALGGDGIFFYPKGQYRALSALAKRPLTLKEAALLQKFDKKASFNIAF